MTLVRFAGRALFSSFFVADGIQSAANPDRYVAEVQRTMDAVLPAARNVLPEAAAEKLPDDTRTWVRILGGVQIAAGAAYAVGVLRRPAAAMLTLATIPHVVGSLPSRTLPVSERQRSYGNLTRNLALLGAGVIATQDTEGRPSLMWRAAMSVGQLGSRAEYGRQRVADKSRVAKANLRQGAAVAELAATRTVSKAKDVLR